MFLYYTIFEIIWWNINVKSNWDLNQTPLIPINNETKCNYSNSSSNTAYDKVSGNEIIDDDTNNLFS